MKIFLSFSGLTLWMRHKNGRARVKRRAFRKKKVGIRSLKMYRITICDDQGDVLDELQQLIMQEFPDMELHCVQDLKEYAKALINQKELLPDIMIMDIQWEQDTSTGIDWAVELQKSFPKLKIIFLTGYIEYAADIFIVTRFSPSPLL